MFLKSPHSFRSNSNNKAVSKLSDAVVSIIVPTYNSERTIDRCLKSLKNQTYPRIDVLVVDGGSTDNTVTIVKEHGLEIIFAEKPSRTHQRNLGALKAKGDYLLYVDSDEVLHPQLVNECIKTVFADNLDGVLVSTIDTGHSYLGKSRYLGDLVEIGLEGNFTHNSQLRFCTKDLFVNTGGYDEDLVVGEDVVFGRKWLTYGFKIGKCKYFLLHYGTEGLKNILRKKIIYGKSFKRFAKRFKNTKSSPYRNYTKVGISYFRNLPTLGWYMKYLPGFFIVKLVETLGLAIGILLTDSMSELTPISRA